jgi:hypothetical protein
LFRLQPGSGKWFLHHTVVFVCVRRRAGLTPQQKEPPTRQSDQAMRTRVDLNTRGGFDPQLNPLPTAGLRFVLVFCFWFVCTCVRRKRKNTWEGNYHINTESLRLS